MTAAEVTRPEPSSERPLVATGAPAIPWSDARERLGQAQLYWLSTVRPDGRLHVRPLLAVWAEGALHFVAGAGSRKARNLVRDPNCVITGIGEGLHFVVEGKAKKVIEETQLRCVADEYASKYDWHVEVRDGAFHADGAPTAGPPPYDVYEISPSTIFAFSEDGSVSAMRWRFV